MDSNNAVSGSVSRPRSKPQEESLRETLVSILIAFVLAFVFRSYVVEPFVIPTGSMAPTLLGAHMEFHSPYSGYAWTANPRDFVDGRNDKPLPLQGRRDSTGGGHIAVTDPMSGLGLAQFDVPAKAGDRILVLKYLYAVRSPKRWDVVVFKNPEQPQQNYIKRLVGLPNEELWIADGDLFTRAANTDDNWSVARKPNRIQRALWRTLYSSEWAPRVEEHDGVAWRGPWEAAGVRTAGQAYRMIADDNGASVLRWNSADWPITDETAYNETYRMSNIKRYPISDLRMRAVITPDESSAFTATASLLIRGQEFQAVLGANGVTIRQRSAPIADDSSIAPADEIDWVTLATSSKRVFTSGKAATVEFWHADQRLSVWVDGKEVCAAGYNWSPMERIENVTGMEVTQRGTAYMSVKSANLSRPGVYRRPIVSWRFEGSDATLTRVGLDRDLYYQPARNPSRATTPETVFTLNSDQFFTLGDNSAASKDGRMWTHVDPWIAEQFDPTIGVVHRDLMMGQAFFVYFPSPRKAMGRVPVPNFGEMRFIR